MILFLKEGEPADSYYSPPQGRFVVDNGFVHPLQHSDNDFTIPGFTSIGFDQFVSKLIGRVDLTIMSPLLVVFA